jgi:hypothetical protein
VRLGGPKFNNHHGYLFNSCSILFECFYAQVIDAL